MNLAQSTLSPEALAHKWNQRFKVGTIVRYWTGTRDGIGKVSITKTEAQVVCGTAVVWVEGHGACIALSHIEPSGV